LNHDKVIETDCIRPFKTFYGCNVEAQIPSKNSVYSVKKDKKQRQKKIRAASVFSKKIILF